MLSSDSEVVAIFESTGAKYKGHFELASRRHSLDYLDAWMIYSRPQLADRVCRKMAERIIAKCDPIPTVIMGPERGSIWIAQNVARILQEMTLLPVQAAFAVKDKSLDEKYPFVIPKRWQKVISGSRVAIVEDVSTTGGSVGSVARLVKGLDGEVVIVCSMWNRGNVTAESMDVSVFESLVNISFPDYAPDECPHCNG